MAISYEEALATLQGMFGEKWSREQLDTVLRHQKGHMENTVDLILSHGDRSPSILIEKLNAGEDPNAHNIDADEELARQLANGNRGPAAAQQQAPPQRQPSQKGRRGTPTQLPADFLRIPNAPTTTSSDQMESDEALARMLQDKMFSEEISRNPDFAHLARGRSAAGRGGGGSNRAGAPTRSRTQQQQPDIDIMKSLGEMGNNARRRLQMLAAQFQAKTSGKTNGAANSTATANGGSTAGERRGLLDEAEEDDGALEFATRKED